MAASAIFIAPNFTTEDLHTLDDCDRAFAALSDAITTIEGQLDDRAYVASKPDDWERKAKASLRYKRIGLQLVQLRRGSLKREFAETWQRRFIETVRMAHPAIFSQVLNEVQPRG